MRVRNVRHVEAALNAGADILYLGGGLMSDLAVLNEAGSLNIPLVLCKDKHHSAEDWLNAAEYVVSRGNRHLILGESGVLGHTKGHPYRLDVESIVKVRQISHLPVIANITGLWSRDMPQEILYGLAKAAGACGIVGTCFEKAGG
ncbi:Chorismate mutase-related protein [Neisseria gonorrhoeae]|nr:Chorismate mutase-related protein [Neisseria gonorrhoeae]